MDPAVEVLPSVFLFSGERENSNLKTLFYKDCSLGLTASP